MRQNQFIIDTNYSHQYRERQKDGVILCGFNPGLFYTESGIQEYGPDIEPNDHYINNVHDESNSRVLAAETSGNSMVKNLSPSLRLSIKPGSFFTLGLTKMQFIKVVISDFFSAILALFTFPSFTRLNPSTSEDIVFQELDRVKLDLQCDRLSIEARISQLSAIRLSKKIIKSHIKSLEGEYISDDNLYTKEHYKSVICYLNACEETELKKYKQLTRLSLKRTYIMASLLVYAFLMRINNRLLPRFLQYRNVIPVNGQVGFFYEGFRVSKRVEAILNYLPTYGDVGEINLEYTN